MSSILKDTFINMMKSESIHPEAIENFCTNLDDFALNKEQKVSFKNIKTLPNNKFYHFQELPENTASANKCAVLKLNGGLGSSMGCEGAKSALKVKNEDTFIDIICKSLLNSSHSQLPLCFMNSFNTDKQTQNLLAPYRNNLNIECFLQNKVPRIRKADLKACNFENQDQNWSPPGHGDVYFALKQSGLLEKLLEEKIEYCFISNADNLGAVYNPKITQLMAEKKIDFLMECTAKTNLDKKGGSPCLIHNKVSLLEIAQVAEEELDFFYDLNKLSLFNTNNIWLHLPTLYSLIQKNLLRTTLITNPKLVNGEEIIQLESAMGSAMSSFQNPAILVVDRDRFLPVKSCADLLYLKSNAVSWDQNKLQSLRKKPTQIALSKHYKNVKDLEQSVPHPLNLVEANSLTIEGPFLFGKDITFTGTNILQNPSNQVIQLSDHSIYQDVEFQTTTDR